MVREGGGDKLTVCLRLSAYFVAKRMAEIPFELIYPLIYSIIT